MWGYNIFLISSVRTSPFRKKAKMGGHGFEESVFSLFNRSLQLFMYFIKIFFCLALIWEFIGKLIKEGHVLLQALVAISENKHSLLYYDF